MNNLVRVGLLRKEKSVTDDGKRHETYYSNVRNVRIHLGEEELQVDVTPNEKMVDRLARIWKQVSPVK